MSQPKKRRRQQPLRTEYIEKLSSEELKKALMTKLTVPELHALERQIRAVAEDLATRAAVDSTQEAYKRQFAVVMRALRDQFGFGHKRLRKLWALCLEYIHDIDEGLLSTSEMLETLKREDNIEITWRIEM